MKNHRRIARLALSLMPAACLAFLPVFAMAQVDPDANGIGIYFDEAATLTSLTVAAGPTAHVALNAWLVATRVSVPGSVRYLEGRVEWCCAWSEVHPFMPVGWDQCWEMPGSIVDDGICAMFEPGELATGDLVILKRYDILLWDDTQPLSFRLRPFRLWIGPEVSVDLHPSSGSWDLPVAVINGPAPVAAEAATWGAVKGLFR